MTTQETSAPPTENKTETDVPRSRREVTRRRLDHVIGYHLLAIAMRLAFKLYARWQIVGIENVPRSGGLLIAANHTSNLDPLMGWAAIYGTRRMWGVAKAELFESAASRYLMACIGTIPVKRGTADRLMLRRVLELLSVGEAVGIFPEGTRSLDGKLNMPQPGVALLVQKSGVPVLPVAILGTHEMLPRGAKNFRRVPLKLVFGTPLHFPADAKRDAITGAIMQAIAALMTAHGQPTDPPTPDRKPPEDD